MAIAEIVLPPTKPETEWVRGRALRKMSPTRNHGRLQMKFAFALDGWARGRGEVVTEWRFRIALPGEARRPLVPDVAFVAAERLRELSDEALQSPPFAPTVAVEVLSADEDSRDVDNKFDVYLRGGSALVIIIDPGGRTIVLYDTATSTRLEAHDVLRHSAFQDFALPVGPFFAEALDRR